MSTQKSSLKMVPYQYIHVLDRNSNITRIEVGPQTFIRQDHELLSTGDLPQKMITLPPRTYCEVTNPVIRDSKGELTYDKHSQIQVNFGEVEIRFSKDYPEPFPLYPRETLTTKILPLEVVQSLTALKIEATRNFKDSDGVERNVGDEWLFKGPATYYPRIEQKIVKLVKAIVIGEQQALKLRAKQNTKDSNGVDRKTGEEWLIKTPGAYLPQTYEEELGLIDATILNAQQAIHLKANEAFKDAYGQTRKAGEEWLVTSDMSSYHIIDVFEQIVKLVPVTVLTKQQYCVINNPLDRKTGLNKYGANILIKGETHFFLQPGEEINGGIKNTYILQEDQALLLRAKEKLADHEPGDKWMIYGPTSFVPQIEVEVIEVRNRIPLDKNEGVYVRDTRTGQVRTVIGETYMLKAHEELWSMDLQSAQESIISKQLMSKRVKHQVVTYKCPYNSAVQVYDYKKRSSRIVFGPELIILGPDEQFTMSALSGGKPKRPGMIKTIETQLGPDFTSDIISVETSDHAALKVQLSYSWYFKVLDKNNQEQAQTIFQVKDFIGDLCNIMASKVRSAVAGYEFEEFHKHSARLIRKSIFGVDENQKIKDEFVNIKNNLVVTNVDIKAVESQDSKTKEALQKQVQMAIQITTEKQEASARISAEKLAQNAKGEIDKLVIDNQKKAEEQKMKLVQLQAESSQIKSKGDATAKAIAKNMANNIQAESKLTNADLKAKALKIEKDTKLKLKVESQNLNLNHEKQMAEIEINRTKLLAEIESSKFEKMINAVGKDTLVSMSQAGPEMQAELLKGLGLQGFIMTDGNNPINLFNTAGGLIGMKPE